VRIAVAAEEKEFQAFAPILNAQLANRKFVLD